MGGCFGKSDQVKIRTQIKSLKHQNSNQFRDIWVSKKQVKQYINDQVFLWNKHIECEPMIYTVPIQTTESFLIDYLRDNCGTLIELKIDPYLNANTNHQTNCSHSSYSGCTDRTERETKQNDSKSEPTSQNMVYYMVRVMSNHYILWEAKYKSVRYVNAVMHLDPYSTKFENNVLHL